MSNSFSKNFETFVSDVATKLNVAGSEEVPGSRFSKSTVSPATILAGDVLFFKYRSDKFGAGDHIVMVVGNKRNTNGIYNYRSKNGKAKKYLSAVKLNKVWSTTAKIIIEAYRDNRLKYSSKKDDSDDPQRFQEQEQSILESKDRKTKQSFMALVGRKNYRSYIINNMWNAYEFTNKKEDIE
ncbi:MAG TPA: hypothetical protein EYQ00_07365 [Dehalococcoidia bacterium]|nr:hypothetical protein [Dehalococcoidia bacterium]